MNQTEKNIPIEFPKVLIVNATALNSNKAESITMRSVFSEWPKERLMELAFETEGASKVEDFGIFSYIVPLWYAPVRFIGNLRFFKGLNKKIKENETLVVENKSSSDAKNILRMLRQWLALTITNSRCFIPADAKRAIRKFKPDVIYTISGGLEITRIVNRIAKKFNIPIVPHFMDNWQDSLEWNDNSLLLLYKHSLNKAVQEMYKHSYCALAISKRMAEVYEKRWHIPHHYLMNSVNTRAFMCYDKKMDKNSLFVYAGGLHLGRWKALNEIGMLIDRYNEEKSLSCVFVLYCPNIDRAQYINKITAKCINFHSPVSHEEIHNIYANADVLVHAETRQFQDNSYVKYSLSTKLPEYLASNRPFLFYGPENIYITQFLLENDACFVGTDIQTLNIALNSLLSDSKTRAKKAETACILAEEQFSVVRSTKVMLQALSYNPSARGEEIPHYENEK